MTYTIKNDASSSKYKTFADGGSDGCGRSRNSGNIHWTLSCNVIAQSIEFNPKVVCTSIDIRHVSLIWFYCITHQHYIMQRIAAHHGDPTIGEITITNWLRNISSSTIVSCSNQIFDWRRNRRLSPNAHNNRTLNKRNSVLILQFPCPPLFSPQILSVVQE